MRHRCNPQHGPAGNGLATTAPSGRRALRFAARRWVVPLIWTGLLAGAWSGLQPRPASAQEVAPLSRGALLYSTHCIACHTEQMHWRDQKLATDWPSLKRLVRYWQTTAKLSWGEPDIIEVTRYLNDSFYRYEAPTAVWRDAPAAPPGTNAMHAVRQETK